jgi:ribonuclease J
MICTIHRGSHQIGGSCIELEHDGVRLILDAGLPLDADPSTPDAALPPVAGLFAGPANGPDICKQNSSVPSTPPSDAGASPARVPGPIAGVLFSHAHQDHYGLAHRIRPEIPLYATEASRRLMESSALLGQPVHPHDWHSFQPGQPFRIGPFAIQPILVDHSAFDACALLIEAGGRRLLYSGDLRAHGRKGKLFERLLAQPPRDVHALLLEGTMLGRASESVPTERELESDFIASMKETPGIVLCTTSSQNLDRLVTIYRATVQAERELVVDLYTAHMLATAGEFAATPQLAKDADGFNRFPFLRVWYPYWLTQRIKQGAGEEALFRFARWKRSRAEIATHASQTVLMVRANMLGDLERMGIRGGLYLYSLWSGYRRDPKQVEFEQTLAQWEIPTRSLHTSGHATPADLQRLVTALAPQKLVPLHTEHPDAYRAFSSATELHEDGEAFEV